MTFQWYVHDILQRLPGAIFQQDNARPHTPRERDKQVSLPSWYKCKTQDGLCAVTTLPCSAQSTDFCPIKDIWDPLGPGVGPPTNLNELRTRLQQIGYATSQDII
ncbi:transposable element Tcb2 transposase [Trichonephila clavipes]|nr:transposable element Tcb2 transposase [Trichonephila clavipes]